MPTAGPAAANPRSEAAPPRADGSSAASRWGPRAGRWCGGVWGGLVLIGLCLSVYLPGLWTIPPVDRDESRFAQASRQMYESGDWVVPRVQERARLNKPPLTYWAQCASVAVFGDQPGRYANGNIWVFRVPSLLAAIGAVLITWRIGLAVMAPRAAALGAALVAISPMVVWDAHQARSDQLLLCATAAAQYGLLRIFLARARAGRFTAWWPVVAMWGGLALGILAKGPITPMVTGLTAAALSVSTGSWRWLRGTRPLAGLALVVLLVAPWVVALAVRLGDPGGELRAELAGPAGAPGGLAAYTRLIFDETIGRSAGAKEGHWGPPGYHLVLLTALMWPGSLLTGLGVTRAFGRAFAKSGTPRPGARRALAGVMARLRSPQGDPGLRFLLCWAVPSWIVFELVSTKLPHYTMPLYPALALVSARAVWSAAAGRLPGVTDRASRLGFAVWWVVGVALVLGVPMVVLSAGRLDGAPTLGEAARTYALPALLATVAMVAAGRALVRRDFVRAQVLSMIASVVWGGTFLQFILPSAQRFWVTPRLVAIESNAHWQNASEFREDSLLFMSRGCVSPLDDRELVRAFAEPTVIFFHGPLLLSPRSELLTVADPSRAWQPKVIATIRGWNYSTGKPVEVVVVEPVRASMPGEGRAP